MAKFASVDAGYPHRGLVRDELVVELIARVALSIIDIIDEASHSTLV